MKKKILLSYLAITLILISQLPVAFSNSASREIVFDGNGQGLKLSLFGDKVIAFSQNSNSKILENTIKLNSQTIPSSITLLNAPESIIEGQVFEGISLVVEDSPGSTIRNNTFINLSSKISISAIKLINSPDTEIYGNVIKELALSNDDLKATDTFVATGIEVISSDGVQIHSNSISNIQSSASSLSRTITVGIRVLFFFFFSISSNLIANLSSAISVNRIIGIYLLKSNFSSIMDNKINNIYGRNQRYSTYASGIYSETITNLTISGNELSQLTTRGTSITAGIRLFNIQQILVKSNTIQYLSSGKYAHGVFLTKVEIGTATQNYFQNISSEGIPFSTAFNLEESNYLTIDENQAVYVDRMVALDIYSTENIIYNNVLNENELGGIDSSPLISPPNNIIYRVDSNQTYLISWVVIDTDPDTFIVYKDETVFLDGKWNSGVPIIVNVTGLQPGRYNYTLLVFDKAGHKSKSTVFVTVTPRNFLSESADRIEHFLKKITLKSILNLSPIIIFLYLLTEFIRIQYNLHKKKKIVKKRQIEETWDELKSNYDEFIDNMFPYKEKE